MEDTNSQVNGAEVTSSVGLGLCPQGCAVATRQHSKAYFRQHLLYRAIHQNGRKFNWDDFGVIIHTPIQLYFNELHFIRKSKDKHLYVFNISNILILANHSHYTPMPYLLPLM